MCLRLHRPFRRAAEDPVHLDDAAAVQQLHDFVESPTCPVWLKKRYAKHNRMPKKKPAQVEVDVPGVSLPAAEDKRVIDAEVAAPTISGVSLRTAENPRVVEAEVAAPTVSGVSLRAAEMSSPSASRSGLVINLSGPRDAWPEPPSDEEAPAAPPQKCVSDELLPDTTAHRQIIANQHGLLWGSVTGDSRYSIVDAIRHQRPPLKLVNVKGYLSAIKDGKLPSGKQVLPLVEQFVFLMLSIDLQPYQRRGAGVYKACLTKAKLKDLIEAFFQSRGSSVTSKEKRNVMMKPYAELWEFVKLETLKQCGLAVSSSPSHRVCFPGQPMNPQSALRDGTWRQQVFCLDPHSLEHEEWEDAAEREAKRIRYVQAAMHEQSMGRPGKKQYEVSLPIDADALTCADFDTRSEWDALHPYAHFVSTHWLSPEMRDKLLPETHAYVLKPSQGGMAHVAAEELSASFGMSLRTTEQTTESIEQKSRMSLRTTGLIADNKDTNSSMSLRTTGLTADNIGPNSSMSLRTTGVTADNIDPNSSMSLRTTGVTAVNIDPNSSMSLRTTGLTADNIGPNSSMSLRTTGVTADNIDPNSSMSLRTTGVTAVNIDPNSSMSLRTTGVTADNIDPNSSMSLRATGSTAENINQNSSSSMSLRTTGLTTEGPALDPTQASFVQHMSSWINAYKSEAVSFKANLPMSQEPEGRQYLTEPVLLLGTAGTGKTTTLQAANRLLETQGLAGRIVRCAYTGVAASNMGMGGRTLVSLFRLSRRGFGGGLEPLSSEDILNMDQELKGLCLLEIDEVSMLEKLVLAHVHARLQQWRLELYHEKHCRSKTACRCGARLPFGGVKVVLAGDFGQLPPVAVTPERTLLNAKPKTVGQDRNDVNLGLRLFQAIRVVFRLRRIHRQVGQSVYKESLLRLRDAAHTKQDVALWKTHDLTDVAACTLSVAERKLFEQEGVHLFCENRRAGQFNGRRLGEDAASCAEGRILRLWSVDSTPGVERYTCDNYGGLRRVLHVAIDAPVMLTMNIRTVWNLVNGSRGHVVAVLPCLENVASSTGAFAGPLGEPNLRNMEEVGGVSVATAQYVIVDFPGYVGPIMVAGHPTWVAVPKQTCRHEKFRSLSRTNFPLVLCYGMTVHKSQGLTVSTRCVFNMEHEPTWSPFKNMCGLAFVGFSRVTDFSKMAFKHVPDYWTFQSMAETDMFRWRSELEQRLDTLHDQTAAIVFQGKSSIQDDLQRHQAFTEALTGSKMSVEALADLTHMLSVRGVLPQPGYKDKPVRGVANKAGGGRSKRKTMRGSEAASAASVLHDIGDHVEDDNNDCDYPSFHEEDEASPEEEQRRQQILDELHAREAAREMGLGPPDDFSDDEFPSIVG